ncbi:MAG: M48 family metallopeptidase [Holosporaceae bacterium]|jgi:Zn-dependent protease with chaperone function|nr:M48 family metallopeptidase [Holosporaceae bacterium]
MEKTIDDLVEKKERIYFYIASVISVIIYGLIIKFSLPTMGNFAVILLVMKILHGLYIGHIRQNAVKISKKQFADIYEIVEDYSTKLQLEKVPEVYILQSNGILNAFATRFLSVNFVVLHSDILELAYDNGKDAVKFIIAHELGHLKRKHIQKNMLTSMAMIVPFLGSAYSRACETTCDNIASYLAHENPTRGLLVLLAGKKLYGKVDLKEFLEKAEEEREFWSIFSEITSSHPSLSSRLKKIQQPNSGNNTEISEKNES